MKEQQHQQKELVLAWIAKALEELETGEEFYIPCHNRDHTKNLLKAFKKELSILEKVDPMSATALHVYSTFKDKRFWTVIKKTTPELSTGFKKDNLGNVSKTVLNRDTELKRRLSLMREDGLTWEEIEEIEGEELPKEWKEEL